MTERRLEVFAILVLLLGAATYGSAFLLRRPDLAYEVRFVLHEDGNQLWRADRILSGKLFYRDVACQYGVLPSYIFAGIAGVTGVSMAMVRWTHLAFGLVNTVLAYLVIRRSLSVPWALATSIVFVVPTIHLVDSREYVAFEPACFWGLLLLWKPPARRSMARSFWLGFVLGMWQTVKFGGAFVAGAALLIVEAASMTREDLPRWFRSLLGIAAGFLLVEASLGLLAFGLLESWLAYETLWPTYVREAYSEVTLGLFPSFHGWKHFLGRQLSPLCMLTLGLAGCLVRVIRSSTRTASEEDVAFIPLIFFLLGVAIYFGHEGNLMHYTWTLPPVAAWTIARLPNWARIAALALGAFKLSLFLKMALLNPQSGDVVPYVLPSHEVVMVSPEESVAIDMFAEKAEEARGKNRFVIAYLGPLGWGGGGFHYYFNSDYDLRNSMIARHGFRPRDEEELLEKLSRVDAIVQWTVETSNELILEFPFRPSTIERIHREFELAEEQPPHGRIFVRRDLKRGTPQGNREQR